VTKSAQEVLEFEREFTLLEERQRIVWVGQLEAPVSLAAGAFNKYGWIPAHIFVQYSL